MTLPKVDPQKSENFVEVAFARTRREAKAYCDALRGAAIPACVENRKSSSRIGVAVLAEATRLVAASDLLTKFAREEDDDVPFGSDDEEEEFEDEDEDEEDDDYSDDDDDDYSDDDDDEDDDYDDDEDEDDDDYEADDDD